MFPYKTYIMDATNKIVAELYFITITVTDWVDIFTRPKYKHIILDSLAYCQKEKELKIYAWVLMSNHLHAIISVGSEQAVADIVRDFKKFTSKQLLAELKADLQESRRNWLLNRLEVAAESNQKMKKFRLWQDGYHPELIYSYDFYQQKLNYIHDNPVRQEIVVRQEEYLYSSAVDYAGGKGLLPVIIVR
jgi:putative transposase